MAFFFFFNCDLIIQRLVDINLETHGIRQLEVWKFLLGGNERRT